jgi:hypothetical protein
MRNLDDRIHELGRDVVVREYKARRSSFTKCYRKSFARVVLNDQLLVPFTCFGHVVEPEVIQWHEVPFAPPPGAVPQMDPVTTGRKKEEEEETRIRAFLR